MTIETFIIIFAAIGVIAALKRLKLIENARVLLGDRSGNSGRGTHWLRNPRIIGPSK